MKDLTYYLDLPYAWNVMPDAEDGGFVVIYPDLPGCMTQVEDAAEIPAMAQEIKELWLETAFEEGFEIPEPVSADYSGKFVLRLPKSLHRTLAERAEAEGVSLNTYAVTLLSERSATQDLARQLAEHLVESAQSASSRTYQLEEQHDDEAMNPVRNRRNGLYVITSAA